MVYPSEYEGFGLPLAEAMAAGCPVIASDLPVIREVVGEAGVLVGPGDTDGWADAMSRLLDEDALREGLVSAGRERAARYTPAETSRRLRTRTGSPPGARPYCLTAPRSTAAVARAERSQANARAGGARRLRLAEALVLQDPVQAAGDRVDVVGVDEHRGVARHLGHRRYVRGEDRDARRSPRAPGSRTPRSARGGAASASAPDRRARRSASETYPVRTIRARAGAGSLAISRSTSSE